LLACAYISAMRWRRRSTGTMMLIEVMPFPFA
jgi:hypothetical protein